MIETNGTHGNDKDNLLKYSVVVSLVLHVALMGAVVLFAASPQGKSLLKPGEQVTRMRLVELPEQAETAEKPPKRASAISDRNHVAEREKLPKLPAAKPARPSKPPIGSMAAPRKKMAALAAPKAPEYATPENEPPKIEQRKDKDERSAKPLKPEPKQREPEKSDPKRLEPQEPKKRTPRVVASLPRRSRLSPSADAFPRGKVDLMPTRQEMEKALASSRPGSPDFFPEGSPEEPIVDINTREERFYSYLLHLKRKIQGVWVYPKVAAKSGMGGELMVEFLIARNGKLLGIKLLDSSGHTILDESAMSAIEAAAPYFPFPSRWRAKRLRVRASFIYVTDRYFRRIM